MTALKTIAGLTVAFIVLSLSGCAAKTRPPGDPTVCYQVQPLKDGSLKYNKMPSNQKDLEHCAAALEAMRLRFLAMGGSQKMLVGAYQGNFIFLQPEGIFTAPTLESHRYLALVRTGDGRLALPGAMPQ
ncbi:MAG: hypothetical protein CGW95_07360 [Phenylobacterium zucineum]|nr:MAG: hypothetical protein CGW95_07360 [Phenylobacterium zucineum]